MLMVVAFLDAVPSKNAGHETHFEMANPIAEADRELRVRPCGEPERLPGCKYTQTKFTRFNSIY